MKKIVLEINGTPKENDILVFRDGTFHPVKIQTLLPEFKETRKKVQEQGKEIIDLKKKIIELAKIIKEK